jgi:[acyl-carrier-protein] S-malonyltransferase
MKNSYIALFPGQGSQSLGMLGEDSFADEQDKKTILDCFSEASSVIGEDLWEITQNNLDKINETVYTQPIMLCADIAIWRVWQSYCDVKPLACAGHSLGEYAALVCAGVISFSDAIKLVSRRANLMQEAVKGISTKMAAIIGLPADKVKSVCDGIEIEGEIVSIANYNSALQTVIAGTEGAVLEACKASKEAGAKLAKPLAVSVPSHCSLLKGAADIFYADLNEISVNNSSFPVYFNIDASVKSSEGQVKKAITEQIYSSVQWVKTIDNISKNHPDALLLEFGPGRVLTGLNKRILSGDNFACINTKPLIQDVLN